MFPFGFPSVEQMLEDIDDMPREAQTAFMLFVWATMIPVIWLFGVIIYIEYV